MDTRTLDVTLDGRPITVIDYPVLPKATCTRCKGTGRATMPLFSSGRSNHGPYTTYEMGDAVNTKPKQRRTSCPRCDGTGELGEDIGPEHVVVDVLNYEAYPHDFPRMKGWWGYYRVVDWGESSLEAVAQKLVRRQEQAMRLLLEP
jgi:hypothetical protein